MISFYSVKGDLVEREGLTETKKVRTAIEYSLTKGTHALIPWKMCFEFLSLTRQDTTSSPHASSLTISKLSFHNLSSPSGL
jgi:hypothetical protein